MITWADVVAVAPELDASGAYYHGNASAQASLIADVLAQLAPLQWGDRYDLACKWLAAHLATIVVRGASGHGPVVSESVGGISRQYANNSPAGTDWIYSATVYGREFARLKRALVGRVGLVV